MVDGSTVGNRSHDVRDQPWASSRDPNDDPGSLEVVPMLEIVLCLGGLCLCSMKFKESLIGPVEVAPLEGKFEVWLQKDKGQQSEVTSDTPIEEIRVALLRDEASSTTIRKFGNTTIRDDDQLQALIRDRYCDWVRVGKPETPAIVDAAEMVPWQDVMCVVNLAKREKMERIQFTAGRDYEAKE